MHRSWSRGPCKATPAPPHTVFSKLGRGKGRGGGVCPVAWVPANKVLGPRLACTLGRGLPCTSWATTSIPEEMLVPLQMPHEGGGGAPHSRRRVTAVPLHQFLRLIAGGPAGNPGSAATNDELVSALQRGGAIQT